MASIGSGMDAIISAASTVLVVATELVIVVSGILVLLVLLEAEIVSLGSESRRIVSEGGISGAVLVASSVVVDIVNGGSERLDSVVDDKIESELDVMLNLVEVETKLLA